MSFCPPDNIVGAEFFKFFNTIHVAQVHLPAKTTLAFRFICGVSTSSLVDADIVFIQSIISFVSAIYLLDRE
jgi:hypothetical protein